MPSCHLRMKPEQNKECQKALWCYGRLWTYLTHKVPSKFVVDDNLNLFFLFSEKISLDISCELSAWQMINMKYWDLFSLANKKIVKTVAGFALGFFFFFSFATIFTNLIFFLAIFFNFEPDFQPNFGHFLPKNYLIRKKVFIYWFLYWQQ